MKLLGLKVPNFLEKVLTNKYVLYAMVFVSIIYVLGFLHIQSWDNLGLFVVVGVLATYFTKNMIIVLALAILVANCNVCKDLAIRKLPQLFGIHEGMTGKDDDEDTKDEGSDKKKLKKSFYEKDGDDCNSISKEECENSESCYTDSQCNKKYTGESMKNRDVPSSKPSRVDGGDEDDAVGGSERIDYAKTLEMAYDNLDKMLGKDGMKGLTDETRKLATQQKGLMTSLNNMAPIINKAKESLSGMDLPDIGNITKTLSNFTNNQKK